MKRTKAFFALSLVVLLAAGPGFSGDVPEVRPTVWRLDPATPGRWFTPDNWTAGTPNESIGAVIANGGTAVIHSGPGPATARELLLGGAAPGTVDHRSGVLEMPGSLLMGTTGFAMGAYELADGRLSAADGILGSGLADLPVMTFAPPRGSRVGQTGGAAVFRGTLHVGYHPYPPIPLDPGDPNEPGGSGPFVGVAYPSGEGDDTLPFFYTGARYELVGGELSAARAFVGYGGTGTVVQLGGAAVIGGALQVSGRGSYQYYPASRDATTVVYPDLPPDYPYYFSNGGYELSGGLLKAQSVQVGHRGRGWFQQTGGAAQVDGVLQVGGGSWWWPLPMENDPSGAPDGAMPEIWPPPYDLSGDGSYSLVKGELVTGGTDVGVGGIGRFTQSGGVHVVEGTLRVGGQWQGPIILAEGETGDPNNGQPGIAPWPPNTGPYSGTYSLSGDGKLHARQIVVEASYAPWYGQLALNTADGSEAPDVSMPWLAAPFVQSGGTVAVAEALRVRGSSYYLMDGRVEAGSVHLTDGSNYTNVEGFAQ